MSPSLQEITDAWGTWKAGKFNTTLEWTASTKYANQSALSQYTKYQVDVDTTQNTVFGDNKGGLVNATGTTQWYDNDTSSTQTNTFTYSDTKANSFTWGLSETLKLGVTAKATVGVPTIGSVDVTTSAEIDVSSNQEWKEDKSTTWSDSNPVVVPCKRSVECQTVIQVLSYDVPFTTPIKLTGSVAIWFHDKVDYNGNSGYHWLYFIPIGSVIFEVNSNNLITCDDYSVNNDGTSVTASAKGVLTGDLGLSINVISQEFSLRGWTPTESDVQKDLLDNLAAAVQGQVVQQYGLASSSISLTANMRALAAGQFKTDFGDDCNANYVPADGQGAVNVVDLPFVVYTETDEDKQISDFVGGNLLNAADLPDWMQADCKADLIAYVKILFGSQDDNQCDLTEYVHTYHAARDDETSMKCASIIAYANGTLTESAVTATIHILYFLGVFYPIDSPIKAAAAQLADAAYKAAEGLVSGSSISNNDGLQDVLNTYAKTKWNVKFGYDYTSNPTDFPSDESEPLLTRNDNLAYFQGTDTSSLDAYVKNQIFSGFNINITEARDDALADVQASFKSVYDDVEQGSWNISYLDKLYLLKDIDNVNPVALNGILVFYKDDTTVVDSKKNQITVTITYIYFIGLIHECNPDSLVADLFKKICATIPGNTDTDLTGKTLSDELKSYTTSGWKTAFSFDFETDPPDAISGKTFQSFNMLFSWPDIPTTDEIKDKVDHLWYKRGDTTVFRHCGDDIYDHLVDQISYFAGSETVKENCVWQQDSYTKQYTFTGSDNKTIYVKEYSLYTFVDGKVTEDGRGGESLEEFAFSYLATFCMIDPDADTDDDL